MTPRKQAPKDESIDTATLPHNLEAERSVLGAVLVHNKGFFAAAEHVKASDFFRSAHRNIYAAIEVALERPNGVADLVTVSDVLRSKGLLEDVGGPAYIAALLDGVPRSTNVEHYARIVADKSLLRRLIAVGQELTTKAYIGEDEARSILTEHDRAVVALQRGAGVSSMLSIGTRTGAMLEYLEARRLTRGQVTGVPTGFQRIDDQTSGWQPGDDVIVAARPSIGKTSFVLYSIYAAALAGHRAAMFSLEMTREQLEIRLLSMLSGVPVSKLSGGWVSSDEDWAAIAQAVSTLGDLPLYIDDTSSRTIEDIRRECRQLQAEGGLGLVAIDYVQLIQGSSRKGANRTEELTHISRAVKVLAKELHVPILLLSQLSRASEKRDEEPRISDLRETGALEQDADIVMFLHRKDHREDGPTKAIFAKGRNIATGSVLLNFSHATTRFSDVDESVVQAVAAEEAAKPAKTAEQKHADKVRAIIRNRTKKRD